MPFRAVWRHRQRPGHPCRHHGPVPRSDTWSTSEGVGPGPSARGCDAATSIARSAGLAWAACRAARRWTRSPRSTSWRPRVCSSPTGMGAACRASTSSCLRTYRAIAAFRSEISARSTLSSGQASSPGSSARSSLTMLPAAAAEPRTPRCTSRCSCASPHARPTPLGRSVHVRVQVPGQPGKPGSRPA